MPSHLSDSEVLEQTAAWLSRMAATIERVTERMAHRIEVVERKQERQADEIRALSNRIEAIHRGNASASLQSRQTGTYKAGE
jgi:Na+/phosphate symporter